MTNWNNEPKDGLGFLKRYGGTRQRIPDHVRMGPVCPADQTVCPAAKGGGYTCPVCGTHYADEGLKGLDWQPVPRGGRR